MRIVKVMRSATPQPLPTAINSTGLLLETAAVRIAHILKCHLWVTCLLVVVGEVGFVVVAVLIGKVVVAVIEGASIVEVLKAGVEIIRIVSRTSSIKLVGG